MTGYLTIGALVVTVAAVTFAGAQSTRLADAQAILATVQSDLDAANARIERQSRQADAVKKSLSTERDRAVSSERLAADLKEKIARLEGTAADGPVAPVLKDTIRGLSTGAVQ